MLVFMCIGLRKLCIKKQKSVQYCIFERQVAAMFFIMKGSKEELELFVCLLNGFEYSVQFTLEVENEGFLLFLDVRLG